MKVLLISHVLDFTGAPLALLELSKSLQRQGHSVFIASIKRSRFLKKYSVCSPSLTPGPILSYFIKNKIEPYNPILHSADNFNVIVANTVVSVPAALDFSKNNNKVVAWIHESIYFFNFLNAHPKKFMLHKLRHAIFPSKFQFDEFKQYMPDCHFMQLRNCVQISFDFSNSSSSRQEYYVCVGKWEDRKNQSRLLKLLTLLNNPLSIQFVGAIRPIEVNNPNYIFTNSISPEDAKSRILQSQGLISCSISEVQPLSVVEAMLSECPVLLSDIPAHCELKELIPDVVIFNLDDPVSFKNGLLKIMEQSQLPETLARIRKSAENIFGVSQFDSNVRDIFLQIH